MQNRLQFMDGLARKEANDRAEVEKISERSVEASEDGQPGELLAILEKEDGGSSGGFLDESDE